jgi:hypothetical protein
MKTSLKADFYLPAIADGVQKLDGKAKN